MSFVRTQEEVEEIARRMRHNRFTDIRRVSIKYRTSPAVIERVLPPGLAPTDDPLAQADVVEVGGSNCVGAFAGGGLYVQAHHEGLVGDYCLAMPMSTDAAIIWGRELFGEPKKHATVSFDRSGADISAAVERAGTQIIQIDATLAEEHRIDPDTRTVFHYKYLPDVTGDGFQFDPTLVRVMFDAEVHRFETGTGTLSLATTKHDPLGDITVNEVLGATYSETDIRTSQENLTTVDPVEFRPYAFGRGYDDWLALDTTAPKRAPPGATSEE